MPTVIPIFSNIPNTQNMTESEYDSAWNQTLSQLNPWSVAANTIASEVEVNAANAEAAVAALASAKWAAGQFTEGDVRWSPTDHLNYRARITGLLTVDPALDPAGWALITKTSNGGADEKSSGVNITLTATDGRVQSIAMTAPFKRVNLPASGAINEGLVFIIDNAGKYTFSVRNNSGDTVARVDPGAIVGFGLVDISTDKWRVMDMNAQHSARSPISLLTEMINASVSSDFAVDRLSDFKYLAIYFATDVNAVVLDESNGVLQAGLPVPIIDSSTGASSDIVALSATSAIVAYRNGNPLDVAVLTINGSSVSVGAGTNIFNVAGGAFGVALAMLTTTRAIAFYGNSSNGFASVLDVSGA